MNKNRRLRNYRTSCFLFICITLVSLLSATSLFRGRAATPNSGTIHATDLTPLPWAGDPTLATGATGGEDQCIDSGPAKNCDSFALNVAGNVSDWKGKIIQVKAD